MAQSTEALLKEVKKKKMITEGQINLLSRRLNAGEKIDLQWIWDNQPKVTPAQAEKGRKWLTNLWVTPKGQERKNNPFGYREELAIETMKGIDLIDFYDAGNFWNSFYVPLYEVYGKGATFQYYVSGGKIHIVG